MISKPILIPALAVLGTLALAMGVRYGLVEPAAVAHLCDSGEGPWWCRVRGGVILAFTHHGLGVAALVLGLLATLLRGRGLALAAAMLGAAGLVLYNFDTSAVGLLLGVLVLARSAAAGEGQA